MELTLRKASALQATILEKINSSVLELILDLNEFQNPQEVIDNASVLLNNTVQTKVDLWNAFYEIRASLGKANASCGINFLLADLAKAEKLIQLYKSVSTKTALQENIDVLNGKLTKIKNVNGGHDVYSSRSDTVRTGVLNSIDSFLEKIVNLTKEKIALNDKLLELNITNKIVLTSTSEEVLKANGVL